MPLHKGGRLHCLFTTSGVAELIDVPVKPFLNRETLRDNWSTYFNFERFENQLNEITFNYCFSTNGIDVSVHLSRPLRHSATVVKPPISSIEKIIGIDPGYRFMFGAVSITDFDVNLFNGWEVNTLLKSASWQYRSENIKRKKFLSKSFVHKRTGFSLSGFR